MMGPDLRFPGGDPAPRDPAVRRRHVRFVALAGVISLTLLGCSGEESASSPAPAAPPELPPAVTAPMPSEISAPEPLGVDEGDPGGPDEAALEAEIDDPPPDLENASGTVRCLVDSPPGCEGCDRGDTCVYEVMSTYECVYVVYGTACPESGASADAPAGGSGTAP